MGKKLSILMAFIGVGLFTLAAWAEGENYGTFMVVKGDISVVRSAGSQEKAKIGTKVYTKDSIVAGKESRAKVIFVDKNIMNISPETKIVIQGYNSDPNNRSADLRLDYGKIRNTVNQKYSGGGTNSFTVKTPSAVAGVRGTDFMTGYSETTKLTKVVTFTGAVEVAKADPISGRPMGDPVRVSPGQFTTSSPEMAKPAAPVEMPKSELARMSNETNADMASFDKGNKGEGDKTDKGPKGEKNEQGESNDGSRQPAGEGGGEGGPTSMMGPGGPGGPGPLAGGPGGPGMDMCPTCAFSGAGYMPEFNQAPIYGDFMQNAVQQGRTDLTINIVY